MLDHTTRQLLDLGGQDLYCQCRKCGAFLDVAMVASKPTNARVRREDDHLVHVGVVQPCGGHLRVLGGAS